MKTQKIFSFLKQFQWTTPFILFLLGYQLLNICYSYSNLETPHLVGKNIQKALTELSTKTLNTRILKEKEDSNVPIGTILHQIPLPRQKIKPHQTVLLTVSKHPQQPTAHNFITQQQQTIISYLKQHKIRYKFFFIESLTKQDSCFAQIPQPGEELTKDGMTLYFSNDTSLMVLFPNFYNQSIEEVKEFLQRYNITPTIFHSSTPSQKHTCTSCKVKEQKPLPGSFVNLKKPFSIQLKVGT